MAVILMHKPNSPFIFSFLFFFCSTFIAMAAPPVILEEGKGQYPLGLHLDTLEDAEGKWTIEDVAGATFASHTLDQKWIPSQKEIPSFGITSSWYWVRFQLNTLHKDQRHWLLEFAYPLMDSIELFIASENGHRTQRRWLVKKAGDALPFHNREIEDQNFLFQLGSLEEAQTFYLRFKTKGTMQFPMTLWTPLKWAEQANKKQYGFGIYYGIMLVMVFYNLFLFAGTQDKNYLFYVLYIIGYTLFSMSMNGLAFQYLWPNYPFWGEISSPIFVSFFEFWLLLFTKSFLQTKRYTPKLNRVLSLLVLSSIFTAGLSFVAFTSAMKLGLVNTLLLGIFMFITGTSCLKQGYTPAKYFLISFVFLILGAACLALKIAGVLPSNFITEYSFQIGSALEAMGLSLALADRINRERKEKYIAQQEATKNLELQLAESIKNVALTQTFEKFVPKQFLNHIAHEGIEKIELGKADTDTITILFSDIRSFTTLSETMSPQELLNFLNAYFKRMSEPIHANGGFIDKFIGDAIMALFDSPEKSDEVGACNAVYAAIDMQKELERYNRYRKRSGYMPIETGIGIHSGEVILGTVGAKDRMDSTVLGDNVNLAARLEGLTKAYKSPIVVSSATLEMIRGSALFLHRELDWVKVKGKSKSVIIHEIFNSDAPKTQELKKKTEKWLKNGLVLRQQQDWDKAIESFQKVLEIIPDDPVAIRHIGNLMKLRNEPLPEDWDGAIQLEQK